MTPDPKSPHQFLGSLASGFDARSQAARASISVAARGVETAKPARPAAGAPPQEIDSTLCGAPTPVSEGIEERLITIGEDARVKKGPLLKEAPGSLRELTSNEELRLYTVEALRKLAKAEGLDLGKAPSRERVVQELASLIVASSDVSCAACPV